MISMFDMFRNSIDEYSDILSDLVDLSLEDKPKKYNKDSFIEVDYEVKSEQSTPNNSLIC